MRELFYPNSVAVIGVSSSPENIARGIVFNLTQFDFQGIIYEDEEVNYLKKNLNYPVFTHIVETVRALVDFSLIKSRSLSHTDSAPDASPGYNRQRFQDAVVTFATHKSVPL